MLRADGMLHKTGIVATVALMTVVARSADGELARGPEVGAEMSLASMLGNAGQNVALGYVLSPYFGYQLAHGLAPFATVQYGRWNSDLGTNWELAAKGGLRWAFAWRGIIPFVEGALGYGQLVYGPSEAVDIGMRSSLAIGVDVEAARRLRLGLLFGVERLDGGSINHSATWLVGGVGATLFPF